MGEIDASIDSRPLPDAFKLIRIQEAVSYYVKLKLVANDYSDDRHSAVKFMLDQIIDIPNLLYMGGDFNIRDADWDPSVSSHPAAGQALMDLADSLGLVRSLPELPVPTHYSDTDGHANSVIDLIFLGMSCAQVLHRIEPDLRRPSDYAPLLVDLPISPENILSDVL